MRTEMSVSEEKCDIVLVISLVHQTSLGQGGGFIMGTSPFTGAFLENWLSSQAKPSILGSEMYTISAVTYFLRWQDLFQFWIFSTLGKCL